MRLTITLFLALLTLAQDVDRKAFDELVRKLADDDLEARDDAAKKLIEMSEAIDGWLGEVAKKESGEGKARLTAILEERRLRTEILRLRKLGLSEALVRAHPELVKRLQSKDPGERLALIIDVTGVTVDLSLNVRRVEPAIPMMPSERGVIVAAAMAGTADAPLIREMIGVAQCYREQWVVPLLKPALRHDDAAIRRRAVQSLWMSANDLTSVLPDLLAMMPGDEATAIEVGQRAYWFDWNECINDLMEALPSLPNAWKVQFSYQVQVNLSVRAEPAMRKRLKHKEADVRRFAAAFYGQHPALDPPADLEALLDDPDAGVRSTVAWLVVPRLPIERLKALRAGEDRVVADAATEELVRRGAPGAREIVKKALEERHVSGPRWMGMLRDATLIELAKPYAEGSTQERRAWIDALAEFGRADDVKGHLDDPEMADFILDAYIVAAGEGALDAVAKLAESGDADERTRALWALEQFRCHRAMELLVKFLKDDSEDIRSEAASVLSTVTDPKLVRAVLEAYQVNDGSATYGLLETGAFKGDEPILLTIFDGGDGWLSVAALEALLTSGSGGARKEVEKRVAEFGADQLLTIDGTWLTVHVPGYEARLREVLKETGDADLEWALAALGDRVLAKKCVAAAIDRGSFDRSIPMAAVPEELRTAWIDLGLKTARASMRQQRPSLFAMLAAEGSDAALDALIQLVCTAAQPHTGYEATALMEVDPVRVRSRVRELTASTIATDRLAAASLLGRVGDASDRVRVGVLFKDGSAAVRAAAAKAAGDLRAEELAAGLIDLLGDADERVQIAAASALGRLASGDGAKLRALAADPRTDVRRAAVTACAKRGDVGVAPALVELIGAAPLDEWAEELVTLGKLGAKPVLELAKQRALKFGDRTARRVLAASGDEEAARMMAADGTMESAAQLIELGKAPDVETLKKLLEESDPMATGYYLTSLNRLVDAKRYDALVKAWVAPRLAAPGRDAYAKAMSECLGIPVTADASALDRRHGAVIGPDNVFGTWSRMIPVFEGQGIVLYSYDGARAVWRKRLGK